MPGQISSALRLIAAGWVLVRHDALVPREISHLLPAPVRFAARVLRLASGPAARRGRPGERLAAAFEKLGPVSIKMGQLLSTRGDIFGQTFAEDLSRLKDRLPPFPTSQAVAEIEAGLGRPLGSLFSDFAAPVGAASLAQAHAAQMADGRRVAVKVLRPRIERRVAADLGAMALSARWVEALAPPLRRLEPKAFVATVARSMALELDMRLEAAAASELGDVMARDPYMRAPAVVWEGVGKRFLTLEWVQGKPLSAAGALDEPGLDRPALADNLIRAFLAQALDHGVFHADLHEGNLFIAAPAQLFAVDFGIVGRLGPGERRFLAEILWGFIRRDYRRIAEVHFEAGYVPATHGIDDFAQALRAVGEPIVGRPASEVSMGRLLGQLFEITGLFDMHMRSELVLLQKTMVTVEGVARRIDPDNDIWAAARPVVERWIARELSPAARLKDLAGKGQKLLDALTRLAETKDVPAAAVVVERPATHAGLVAVIALAALVIALSALVLGRG
ncbi:MAG TPA: 2-polyprenylphenol 6-hydroxylase [Caulobacteraceae bacterium]|jgi:ubiquinone biosynthesis protein|nr:2-polyprenylphenol 6-hydroxylase [Caulobacteraceae bacterium]